MIDCSVGRNSSAIKLVHNLDVRHIIREFILETVQNAELGLLASQHSAGHIDAIALDLLCSKSYSPSLGPGYLCWVSLKQIVRHALSSKGLRKSETSQASSDNKYMRALRHVGEQW